MIDRLGFGPRPGDRDAIAEIGPEAYIQQQLNPSADAEPTILIRQLGHLSTLELSPVELFRQGAAPRRANDEQRQRSRVRQVKFSEQAEKARIIRALESPNQLQEVMVDFWFNHFNVFVGKSITRLWLGNYEKTAIRPHVLGNFRDLLGATAKHPAMLFYLDNWRNTDPNSDGAKGSFKGLNENYARELMELHTLGVDGGYTQADVENLTRILTGWSVVFHNQPAPDDSGFVFAADRHAPGSKTLLGTTIAQGGQAEGEKALDLLAAHPSTARNISYKLAQYFVADNPSADLVERLSSRFLETEGDIRAVLQALFSDSEFWNSAHYQKKFKTPYQYTLSMARAVNLVDPSDDELKRVKGIMNQMGMALYKCQMPDGYAQVESAWLSPDSMMRRISMAIRYANQQHESLPEPTELLATLGNPFPPRSRAAINEAPPHMRQALILGSPEMMYR